jgi:secreted Zn-dependent insulinase-like peptidase
VQPLEDPPDLIADAPGLQIWHKLDRTFQRPIAVAYLAITPRAAYNSPKTAALTHLVLKLLQDDVCETAYLADVAGLQYDVSLYLDAFSEPMLAPAQL